MNDQHWNVDIPILNTGPKKLIPAKKQLLCDISDEPNPDDGARDYHQSRMFGDIMLFRSSHAQKGKKIGTCYTSQDAVPKYVVKFHGYTSSDLKVEKHKKLFGLIDISFP